MVRFIAFVAALAITAGSARAEVLVGLTTANGLVTFDSASAGTVSAVTPITGATGLIGIDYRPTTGVLYGASRTALYTIDRASGVASLVANLSGLNTSPFVAYGIDFNPVADLTGPNSLRLVNSAGQNYRVNVQTGAVTLDGAINGLPSGVSLRASAYSGNDTDPATGTVLYGIGSDNNLYASTPPAGPNAGTYSLVGALGPNSLFSAAEFDISGSGTAFAVLNLATLSQLYSVNLTTGQATSLGVVGGGTGPTLIGVAVLPSVATPLPPTLLMAVAGPLCLALVRRRLS